MMLGTYFKTISFYFRKTIFEEVKQFFFVFKKSINELPITVREFRLKQLDDLLKFIFGIILSNIIRMEFYYFFVLDHSFAIATPHRLSWIYYAKYIRTGVAGKTSNFRDQMCNHMKLLKNYSFIQSLSDLTSPNMTFREY